MRDLPCQPIEVEDTTIAEPPSPAQSIALARIRARAASARAETDLALPAVPAPSPKLPLPERPSASRVARGTPMPVPTRRAPPVRVPATVQPVRPGTSSETRTRAEAWQDRGGRTSRRLATAYPVVEVDAGATIPSIVRPPLPPEPVAPQITILAKPPAFAAPNPGATLLGVLPRAATTFSPARGSSPPAQAGTLLGVVSHDAVEDAVQKVLAERALRERRGDGGNRHQPVSRAITPTPDQASASGEIVEDGHHAAMAAPITELVPHVAPSRTAAWRVFDKIGLGKPKAAPGSFAAKAIVTAYRMLGFGILTAIVVVLVGYIATTAFYYFSTSWVVPTVVSASDEKVVALRAELATQLNARDRIAGELADAERAIEANQLFQLEFAKAIAADSSGKKLELERTKQLASAAASTRYSIKRTTDAYAANTAVQTRQELDAGLIDRTRALASKVQLAEISSQNLSLAERQAALEGRAAELATTTRALDALLDGRDAALPYDVLKIKKDYQASKLELARAMASRAMLQKSLARQDDIIAGVRQSAYLRALEDGAVVAVVPYDNIGNVSVGAPLVACKVQMVMCHRVGTVLEILPGEVTFKHPHKSAQLRGRMIELKLDEADAAEKDVLFVGGAPLWL